MAEHLLITRFNLASKGREVRLRQSPGWLRERFELFDRYCLPSVAAQDSGGFSWLIFFDTETPEWARERIAAAQAMFPFEAIFTGLFEADGWARHVRAQIGPPQPGRVVVTSNLDNDDGIARDYLRRVREAAAANWRGAPFAVNAPDGLVLAGDRLYRHRHLCNAFTTLVEADDDRMRTTKTIRHMELADHVPVVQAPGPAAWLQVVHDGNVSNRVRGRRVGPVGADFPPALLAGVAEVSRPALLWDNAVVAPVRDLRDAAFRIARRVKPVDK